MKNTIFLLGLCLGTSLSIAQTLKSSGLKGPVSEVVSYGYDIDKSNHLVNQQKSIWRYDKKRNLLEYEKFSTKGVLISKSVNIWTNSKTDTACDYDEKNRLKGKSVWKYNNDQQTVEVDEVYYNSSLDTGVIAQLFKNKPAPLFKKICKYDKAGNRIEEDSYSGNILHYKVVTFFTKDNLKIRDEEFDRNGVLTSSTIFKYSKSGNLIETIFSYTVGKSKIQGINKYSNFDRYGNWLSETYQDNESKKLHRKVIKYY